MKFLLACVIFAVSCFYVHAGSRNFNFKLCMVPNRPNHANFKIIRKNPRPFGSLLHEGDYLEYTCKEGFALFGAKKRTCMKFGFVSGAPVTCGRQVCHLPQKLPPHTQVTTGHKVYMYKDAVFFCDYGYHLEGRTSIKCLMSGEFDGEVPRCVKDKNLQ